MPTCSPVSYQTSTNNELGVGLAKGSKIYDYMKKQRSGRSGLKRKYINRRVLFCFGFLKQMEKARETPRDKLQEVWSDAA